MAVDVVDLLELVKIDVYQAEDGPFCPGSLDLLFEVAVEGKPVVHVGKQIELRSIHEVFAEFARFDSERSKANPGFQSRGFVRGSWFTGLDCRKKCAERSASTSGDVELDAAQPLAVSGSISEPRAIRQLAPGEGVVEAESHHLRDCVELAQHRGRELLISSRIWLRFDSICALKRIFLARVSA